MLSDGRKCDEDLDSLALLACQDYNLGNAGNWFFSFRGGLSGFRSRMVSLEEHRELVYEWHPFAFINMHERHIAVILFSMDSALECTVFAMNALGQARDKAGFRDVSEVAALRRISLQDVLGTSKSPPLSGYMAIFPKFQRHFSNNASLIRLVQDNHDVSKHRQQSFWGGKTRSDPPPGFFDRLGYPPEHPARNIIAPMSEVLIPIEPKLPIEVLPSDRSSWTKLESLIDNFRTFINEAICLAHQDAKATLNLPITSLRSPT